MPPLNHAYLSPSDAHRWMKCPASPYLESYFPDEEKPYTTEGTLAHEYAEKRLTQEIFHEPVDLTSTEKRISDLYANHPEDLHDSLQDVKDNVEGYVDFVMEQIALDPKTFTFLEQKLSLGDYIPQGAGTSDVVLIQSDTVHVIDFKYGEGLLVDAKNNPQLMIYALGSIEGLADLFTDAIQTVKMSIYQPRRHHVQTWEIPYSELKEWGTSVLAPAADKAFVEREEFHSGDWCRFCKAKNHCSYSGYKLLRNSKYFQDHTLSPEEQAYVLAHASEWTKQIESIQKGALADVLAGKRIPGYKAVHKRAREKLDSGEIEEIQSLAEEYGIPVTNTTLRTPKQVATACSKKKVDFEEVFGKYVIHPEGGPTLVPDSDPREAILSVPELVDDLIAEYNEKQNQADNSSPSDKSA